MHNTLSTKNLFALITAATVSLFANAASATGTTNVISDITVEGSYYARVAMAGSPIGGRPACHNAAYTVHYQWDITTSKGKAMLSLAQAAQLAGKRVTVTGSGTCVTGNASIEMLNSITLWTN